jgi:alpha-ketoglutarate-dependent taurine dioxygenase
VVAPAPPPATDLASSVPDGFGAVVVDGLDAVRHAPDARVSEWVRGLLWDHGVVCLRQPAALTDEEHRALVRMIGPVKDPVGLDVDGQPLRYGEEKQIIDAGFVLTDELRASLGDVAFGGDDLRPGLFEFFHTDDSYVECPAAATVLHARELPSGPGGATSFLDMRAAWQQLDGDEQQRLDGLRAVHAYNNQGAFPPRASAAGPLERLIEVSHPVVRAHPVTGAPALYFDLDRAHHIDGMAEAEGQALLQSLQDRAERDAPRYAHAWQDHDVLLWDNASVQHKAGGDFAVGEPRRFWRFMVEGGRPIAYARPA